MRNDDNVRRMAARATVTRPFLGHKGVNFFSTWEGVDWDGHTCDKMHDYKLLCEMVLKGLVGPGSSHGWYQEWRGKKRILFTDRIVKLSIYSPNFIPLRRVHLHGDLARRNFTRVTCV